MASIHWARSSVESTLHSLRTLGFSHSVARTDATAVLINKMKRATLTNEGAMEGGWVLIVWDEGVMRKGEGCWVPFMSNLEGVRVHFSGSSQPPRDCRSAMFPYTQELPCIGGVSPFVFEGIRSRNHRKEEQ